MDFSLPPELVALVLAPVVSAPAQVLYLKAGRRYDIGAVLFVALGAVVGILAFERAPLPPQQLMTLQSLLVLLAIVSSLTFGLRLIALAKLSPLAFTLISLAQMWATVPLMNYSLQTGGHYSGIHLGTPASSPALLITSVVLTILTAAAMSALRLPAHLRAATDGTEEYEVLVGSKWWLALRLELICCSLYLSAGILLGLSRFNLSPLDFGSEALWMLLAVAPIPRFRLLHLLWIPAVVVILRTYVARIVPADLTMLVSFVLLALVLGGVGHYEWRVRRVARA